MFATYFTLVPSIMCQYLVCRTVSPPCHGIWIITPLPSLDWCPGTGWLLDDGISGWSGWYLDWMKYCRAHGQHHLRMTRMDIWFTKTATCSKIDVRELFIFYPNFFSSFFSTLTITGLTLSLLVCKKFIQPCTLYTVYKSNTNLYTFEAWYTFEVVLCLGERVPKYWTWRLLSIRIFFFFLQSYKNIWYMGDFYR